MTTDFVKWHQVKFSQLSNDQLYELLKLRVDIFVVEQNCPYPELDDKDRDKQTYHLLGLDADGALLAYARVLAPGISYTESSIGRVAVSQQVRGKGIAKPLMEQAIETARQAWPKSDIKIGAQEYLLHFYQGLGFKPISDVYLEDGIPHLDMLFQIEE